MQKTPPPLEFALGGMHCAACSSRIERVLGSMPEVAQVSVSLASNSAQIVLRPESDPQIASAAILKAVADLGFTAEQYHVPLGKDALTEAADRWKKQQQEQQRELEARKREIIPAFLFAIPLLIFSMGEMLGMPLPASLHPQTAPLTFALVQCALCLPVLWIGRRFFIQGLPALWRKSPTMDSLVALGTGAAVLFSIWNIIVLATHPTAAASVHAAGTPSAGILDMLFGTAHGSIELYFESAAVVIALVSLGKYAEARSKVQTGNAMKGLLELAPETATRVILSGVSSDDTPENIHYGTAPHEDVPLAAVNVGDILLVRPGGRIPVDGVVIEGLSFVDESMLTGESMHVEKGVGATIAGGSMNMQGAFFMRAERVGSDTVLARIVNLVQAAQASKAPIASLADTVSLYFVPAVIAIATLAALGWWLWGDSASFAVRIFVSVMVIACPCAMGLATPMSIVVGVGRGAQLGVLFKNGETLERTAHISTMVFDKTGTLTQGRAALVDIAVLEPTAEVAPETPAASVTSSDRSTILPGSSAFTDFSPVADTLLQIAASVERGSEHPLARAITQKAEEKGLSFWPVENFSATPGRGVAADVLTPTGALHVTVSNASLNDQPPGYDSLKDSLASYADEGKTPVILTINGAAVAIFAIADPIRPEAASVIQELHSMGIACVMLTGDNSRTAHAVARQIGITQVIAQVLPEEKEAAVARLQQQGHVVGMVGDGVNDAPALARADVGIAMKGAIDVAMESGDVVLMQHTLRGLLPAIGLGKATLRNIKENLFWAFAYNVVCIPFAAGLVYLLGGPVLSPMLAGAAMALSSGSVVMNALRLRLFYRGKQGAV